MHVGGSDCVQHPAIYPHVFEHVRWMLKSQAGVDGLFDTLVLLEPGGWKYHCATVPATTYTRSSANSSTWAIVSAVK